MNWNVAEDERDQAMSRGMSCQPLREPSNFLLT